MAVVRHLAWRRQSEKGATQDSTEDWVRRVCAGDAAAFERIFERYGRAILRFLHDMVGDSETAEDLAQETFVRAYQHLHELRQPDKLSTWLFGIARNVARESLRKRQRERPLMDIQEDAQVANPRLTVPSPERAALRDELNQTIRDALQSLDEDRRTVFSLRVFHEQSYEEIAAITGFSLSKLKSDLHRARVEMRQRIRPYLESPNEV